jgi:hypothetical protein
MAKILLIKIFYQAKIKLLFKKIIENFYFYFFKLSVFIS